jgi:outer membrane murein-binding lipoprotein Lpp
MDHTDLQDRLRAARERARDLRAKRDQIGEEWNAADAALYLAEEECAAIEGEAEEWASRPMQ